MYNPITDFICYAREKYGDVNSTCYKNDGICCCHEDREIIGKSHLGDGCTPADSITYERMLYIKEHKNEIEINQQKLEGK
tara:strand:+ start:132 stop:371 length:240 start_codon:yes stop_codon:yes gene_type:complete